MEDCISKCVLDSSPFLTIQGLLFRPFPVPLLLATHFSEIILQEYFIIISYRTNLAGFPTYKPPFRISPMTTVPPPI